MPRKLRFPLIVAAALAVSAPAVLHAQDSVSPPPDVKPHVTPTKKSKPLAPPAPGVPTPQSGPGAFDPEARLATLTTRLKLTPEQQGKLRPVLADTEAKVKEARAPGTSPLSARDKVKSILENDDLRIQVVLDGVQKEEWAKMKEELKLQTRTPFKATTLE